MKKEDQLIMAVKREILFQDHYFEGFSSLSTKNFKKVILDNFEYKRRGDLETNEEYKQPITYIVLLNESGELFSYKRSVKDENYTEKRLRGMWSCGLGGHVDLEDNKKEEDPIISSAKRELTEEVLINGELLELKEIGYINDDSQAVERVHFGIVFLARIKGIVVKNDNEIMEMKMKKKEKLLDLLRDDDYQIEKWSRIIIENIDNIL